MHRQSSSRNQRSKGIKIKHVLQICLLLAVSFWLIYQVKHSHDKKKEFDESNGRAVLQRASDDEFIKLGRKDIHSRVDETVSKNEDDELAEEEDEAAGEKIEENKNEEDELDYKAERKEDEGTGGGDDEVNEHEQEKSDGEVDREEEVVDEEEREDRIENGIRETDSEHAHGQADKEVSAEDADHDGDDRSINEAREEQYKADDASSAVTHNTQVTGSVNENLHGESSNEITANISEEENKENNSEETNEGENRKSLELEDSETAGDDHHLLNVTAIESKFDLLENSENGTFPNNTVTEGFSDHLTSNHSNEVTAKSQDSPLQNATESQPEFANPSVVNANGSHFDFNSTVPNEPRDAESHSEEFPHSSDNASKKIIPWEPSVETENSTEISSEMNDEMKTVQLGETMESTMTENPEGIVHDAIDISDTTNSLEENNVRMDLDTLPDIKTEGTNTEDLAAE